MKNARTILLVATLAATGLWIVFSIQGAFLGTEQAKVAANTAPVAIFWGLLVTLLVAGIVYSNAILRRPGSLAMHAGAVLVVVGAMWGSDAGHRLAGRIFGAAKIPAGHIDVPLGQQTDEVMANGTHDLLLGRLPFVLRLDSFWIDYYEQDDPWQLWADVHVSDTGPEAQQWRQSRLDRQLGREVALPGTATRLTVLEYLPGARPVYPDDAPAALEIIPPRGDKLALPAVVGREASVDDPKLKLRIVQVFTRLLVRGQGPDRQVVDEPGDGQDNPAIAVEAQTPDGAKKTWYVLANAGGQPQVVEGVELRYAANTPLRAEPDPASGVPAVWLSLARTDGTTARLWLLGRKDRPTGIALAWVLGPPLTKGDREAAIWLGELAPAIKCYNSDVAVVSGGAVQLRQTIQVNHPLHYGGYDFYQMDYDQVQQRYTVLGVVSDSGLWCVFTGFALICAGAFWHFWLVPAARYFGSRRSQLRNSAGNDKRRRTNVE